MKMCAKRGVNSAIAPNNDDGTRKTINDRSLLQDKGQVEPMCLQTFFLPLIMLENITRRNIFLTSGFQVLKHRSYDTLFLINILFLMQ